MRHAMTDHLPPRCPLERLPRTNHVVTKSLGCAHVGNCAVRITLVGDLVTTGYHLSDQFGQLVRDPADHEERRTGAVRFE